MQSYIKHILLVFNIITIMFTGVMAQSSTKTNLVQNYNLPEYNDSLAFMILHDSAWYYFGKDISKSHEIIKLMDYYSKKSGNKFILSNYYSTIGSYKNLVYDNDSAIFYMDKAVNIVRKGMQEDSLNYSYIRLLPSLYNNTSIIYSEMGLYQYAIESQLNCIYCLKKIEITTSLNYNMKVLDAMSHTEMAMYYSDFMDTVKANKYFQIGIDKSVLLEDLEAVAYAKLNYGIFLLDIGEFDKAYLLLEESKYYYIENNDIYNQLIIYYTEGNVFMHQEKYSEAIELIDSVIMLTHNNGFAGLEIASIKSLFFLYLQSGDTINALKISEDYLSLANSYNELEGIAEVKEELAIILFKKGDIKKAYEYLIVSKKIKDTLVCLDYKAKAEVLESKFKLEQRNQENSLLVNDNKLKDEFINKQKTNNKIIFALFFLSLVFAYILFMNRKRINKINAELEITNDSLITKTEELEQSNIVLQKIFSLITHDVKGPIGTANMFFGYLNDNTQDISQEQRNEYIKLIGKSMGVTYNILEGLLYWSQNRMKKKVDYSTLSLSELVVSIIDNLESTVFTKQITLTSKVQAEVQIKSDTDYIRIVLRNIISNAIKYTKEGGAIGVDYKSDENLHYIFVTDNGVGMTEELAAKLFKQTNYESTVGTQDEIGTGLGLMISNELIIGLGGKIKVESKLGEGSTFIIELPL